MRFKFSWHYREAHRRSILIGAAATSLHKPIITWETSTEDVRPTFSTWNYAEEVLETQRQPIRPEYCQLNLKRTKYLLNLERDTHSQTNQFTEATHFVLYLASSCQRECHFEVVTLFQEDGRLKRSVNYIFYHSHLLQFRMELHTNE